MAWTITFRAYPWWESFHIRPPNHRPSGSQVEHTYRRRAYPCLQTNMTGVCVCPEPAAWSRPGGLASQARQCGNSTADLQAPSSLDSHVIVGDLGKGCYRCVLTEGTARRPRAEFPALRDQVIVSGMGRRKECWGVLRNGRGWKAEVKRSKLCPWHAHEL